MNLHFSQPLAIVDLETTGASPRHDRVTEIGIVFMADGQVERAWSTLVNPGCPIPYAIQRFTGITDAMVQDAPHFAELAEELRAQLAGRIFIAHNARFDYGFLRSEYRRLNARFAAPVLCTVRLSRSLFPEHHRHGLDALIERHQLHCSARHRALGDAQALEHFLRSVVAPLPQERVAAAIRHAMQTPALPPQLDADAVEDWPEGSGVYRFYGADGKLLHMAASAQVRAAVLSHFGPGKKGGGLSRLARAVTRIECDETPGELGARLAELRLRRLQHADAPETPWFALRLQAGAASGTAALERVDLSATEPGEWTDLYGPFRGATALTTTLRELCTAWVLCAQRVGLEAGRGPCSAGKRCKGACSGGEPLATHDLRLATALGGLRMPSWPYGGRIGVVERAWDERADIHVFDQWCHLGTYSPADLPDLPDLRVDLRFDGEVFRMLPRQLAAAREVLDLTQRARSL
ncbi:MAG: ethanolamine utilization protein [Rhodocyclaceae bacterium]|nr:ethanolamine utilization protein [Rhodocyclaceae bacterium]